MTITRRAALAAPALLLAAGARAQGAQIKWQMATPYPDGNFHTRNIKEFAADLEQATGGKLSLTVHSNASLLPMPQIKRGVQSGQVQLGEILLAAYSNEDPFFEADRCPSSPRTSTAPASWPACSARISRRASPGRASPCSTPSAGRRPASTPRCRSPAWTCSRAAASAPSAR